MTETTATTREPKRIDPQSLERLEANRRMIVLIAVSMFRGGTSVPGLTHGLKIMQPGAIVGTLKTLDASGLIYSRFEPSRTAAGIEMRRYYLSDDVSLDFNI